MSHWSRDRGNSTFRPALTLFALVAALSSAPAHAHKPSDSYLTLERSGTRLDGRWDVSLRDLDYLLGLDANHDGELTWGEVRTRQEEIGRRVLAGLRLRSASRPCALVPGKLETVRHSDGAYAVLSFTAACEDLSRTLEVDYQLFFDRDPQHRGLLRVEGAGATRTAIFSSAERHLQLELGSSDRSAQFAGIVAEGVHHIWTGYDHLLFLIALLLPSVLVRREGRWIPLPSFRPAFFDVLKIVSAFTLAHSLTLSLAALHLATLPSRFIESAIAASVVLAALNNLIPVLGKDRWVAAFALGLLHGFGFSAVLGELGLAPAQWILHLFGFNLGVELGQLAVVGTLFPLAYLLRRSTVYPKLILGGGSLVALVIACGWFVERAFQVSL